MSSGKQLPPEMKSYSGDGSDIPPIAWIKNLAMRNNEKPTDEKVHGPKGLR